MLNTLATNLSEFYVKKYCTLFIPTSHGTTIELIYSMQLNCRVPI